MKHYKNQLINFLYVRNYRDKIKKITLVLGGLVFLGIIGSYNENREHIPSYTPEGFQMRAEQARIELDKINIGQVLEEDTYYYGTKESSYSTTRNIGSLFQQPTACLEGTLIKDGETSISVRCAKGYTETIVTDQSINQLISYLSELGWTITDNSEKTLDYKIRNFQAIGSENYEFKNATDLELRLSIASSNKNYCRETFYCNAPAIKADQLLVTISILARHQTF